MLKFIVISDLHLVPQGQLAQGVDTTQRLRSLIAHVNQYHADAEFCVAAGDLADAGDGAAYQRLHEECQQLRMPVIATLGNHDCREAFGKVFSDTPPAPSGYYDHCIDIGDHRVLVMDSLDSDQDSGLLVQTQLDWLEAKLRDARNQATVLVLHHHICDLQISTDAHRLRRRTAFFKTLQTATDLRHIIFGHVHLDASGTCCGILFTALAGCHYNIAPRRSEGRHKAPRFEGPGQYGVVWSNRESTIVLREDFDSRHLPMPPELFRRRKSPC
ncbi:MAG: metallophosphoesterase [Rhodobacteraceae bacterium]|nr:metallophosphoesterase [Paracoccaceae bacterium]